MNRLDLEFQRLVALRAFVAGMLELKWLRDATRFEIAMRRHEWALKAGFNPDQPRVPKGNSDGGKWSGDGNSSGGPDGGDSDSPEGQGGRPARSRDRMIIVKEIARRIFQTGETVVTIARMSSWLQTYSAQINTYNDPPKSLDELQRAASTSAPGYDIHHIVEQTQAERDGFSREIIDGPDNLVRVPRLKHQEINGWYQSKNDEFGGMTPREYLNGRSWKSAGPLDWKRSKSTGF